MQVKGSKLVTWEKILSVSNFFSIVKDIYFYEVMPLSSHNSYAEALIFNVGVWKWDLREVIRVRVGHKGVALEWD